MDLTARDPSKVPRCILSRFASVNEAQAEWELAGEILSDPELAEESQAEREPTAEETAQEKPSISDPDARRLLKFKWGLWLLTD